MLWYKEKEANEAERENFELADLENLDNTELSLKILYTGGLGTRLKTLLVTASLEEREREAEGKREKACK